MRDRTLRTKQSHDSPTKRTSSCSLHRTWTIYTRELVWQQKRWCKFTATFSSRVVRAANLNATIMSSSTRTRNKMLLMECLNMFALSKRRHVAALQNVQPATRSYGQALSGLANNFRETNWNQLKIFSMAE